MKYIFFRSAHPHGMNPIDLPSGGYDWLLWRPSLLQVRPSGLNLRFFPDAWWAMHHFHIFSNRKYAIMLAYQNSQLVHYTFLFPRYFPFPFMGKDDINIGETWTHQDHRGRGLAPYAVHEIVKQNAGDGRVFWYIATESNIASIRVITKVGFEKVGEGFKIKRLGSNLLGYLSYHET